jgi:sugar O-acyltransferase (sialic acid O-acetyltransferase NeuD family)
MKKPIAIYGAGSFGREVFVLIMQINESQEDWELIGFFDDNLSTEDKVHSLPVIGNIDTLNAYSEPLNVIIAIGNPVIRKRIVSKIKNPLISFPVLVHPSVQLAPYQNISIGEGSLIAAGNILTVDITIGRHVLLNIACTCGHDVVFGDFASIMPNCIIFGPSVIGEESFIATGAAILNRVELAPSSRIGVREVVMNGVSKILQ